MKKSITLSALFVLLTACLFAASPVKASAGIVAMHDEVSFSSLPSNNGVEVKVLNSQAGKASIVIYDADKNVLRKDVLKGAENERGYNLTSLENGDYTIEVTANGKTIKENVHVYDEDQTRMFIING